MRMRPMGRTGLKVSVLCLGGNVFGWTADEAASEAVLDAFVAAGGNFIDTADGYSRWVPGNRGGESETILGQWMERRGNRGQIILATKCGSPYLPGVNEKGQSRRYILQAVELSLKRLRTDYIDLYQAHYDDPETPLDETLRAYDDLVRSGKVRYIGASNYPAWRLAKAVGVSDRRGWARFETLQPKYNLIDREYEREHEPLCRDEGIGVIPYSSLASGFLSGKYRRNAAMPGTPRAAGIQRSYTNDRGWAVLDAIDTVAADTGATPAQIALAWLMARPGITAPIASATSVEQLTELAGAAEVTLPAEAIQALDVAGKL